MPEPRPSKYQGHQTKATLLISLNPFRCWFMSYLKSALIILNGN